MPEEKSQGIKIELPEGTIEARGSEKFLAQVRSALVAVLTGQQIASGGPSRISQGATPTPLAPTDMSPTPPRLPNIRDLYAEKRPATDTQTAALIAYYLSEVAPPAERSETVDTETVVNYFKLCPRELPRNKRQLLHNAKRDGYLESVDRGRFKLTAIGYNLVVHGLPAGPAAEGARGRRRRGTAKKTGRRKGR